MACSLSWQSCLLRGEQAGICWHDHFALIKGHSIEESLLEILLIIETPLPFSARKMEGKGSPIFRCQYIYKQTQDSSWRQTAGETTLPSAPSEGWRADSH